MLTGLKKGPRRNRIPLSCFVTEKCAKGWQTTQQATTQGSVEETESQGLMKAMWHLNDKSRCERCPCNKGCPNIHPPATADFELLQFSRGKNKTMRLVEKENTTLVFYGWQCAIGEFSAFFPSWLYRNNNVSYHGCYLWFAKIYYLYWRKKRNCLHVGKVTCMIRLVLRNLKVSELR